MTPITTHVLDTSTGKPACGLAVTLEHETQEAGWQALANGVTDNDGRINNLITSHTEFSAGRYRLTFETGDYFYMRQNECFFPQVTITFVVKDAGQHFHVPLLLSPFSYSTYRGT
jgi:5-hydroxyisourate hydrolase